MKVLVFCFRFVCVSVSSVLKVVFCGLMQDVSTMFLETATSYVQTPLWKLLKKSLQQLLEV